MKIKKIYLFILFITAFLFIYSCQNRLNPRYYYNKSASDENTGGDDLPGEFDPDNPSIPIWPTNYIPDFSGGSSDGTNGTNTVYLDPFVHGEWNKPDYRFNMNFDNMQIRASFDGNNRPSYQLVSGNWNFANSSANSYYYDGPNTTAGGQSLSSVQYWLYKSKNPLFSADSRYNKSDRMKRFYFYRFNGKALGMVYTDNYLVAIDTYSKLVFAYAVPVEWKQYIAGTPKAPIKWGSVDAGWETDYNSGGKASFKVSGATYFYEYDPIGIVKQNGEIEIYKWCLDSIGNNKRYGPRIDGGNARDLSRPIATYGMPGRSPYIPIKTNISGGSTDGVLGGDDYGETTKDIITVTAKSLRSIGAYTWRFGAYYLGKLLISEGYYHYKIGGVVYDGNFPSEVEYIWRMNDLLPLIAYEGELSKFGWGETKYANNHFKSYEIEDIKRDKDIYIDLAADIAKYNLSLEYVDTAGFGNNYSGWVANKDSQKVRLIYSPDKDAFVVDSVKDENDFSQMTVDKNFTLKRGEKKDFTIKYVWKGSTGYYETMELTYTLGFKAYERVDLKNFKF